MFSGQSEQTYEFDQLPGLAVAQDPNTRKKTLDLITN